MDYALKNSLVFFVPFVIDQVTKHWAISELVAPWHVFPFLTFELVYNRGITWGMFNDAGSFSFVTLAVVVVAVILAVHTFKLSKEGRYVVPQLLVLSGAVSNILDRVVHAGVVDFITLHFGSWNWATFNVADACIVVGVIWMFFAYEE